MKAGGEERPGKGSHRVVKAANGKPLSLPTGVLKTGLLRGQIRKAGLTEEEEFIDLLG